MKEETHEVKMLFSGEYFNMVKLITAMSTSVQSGEPEPVYLELNAFDCCGQAQFHVEAESNDEAIERVMDIIDLDWFDRFDLDFDGWA